MPYNHSSSSSSDVSVISPFSARSFDSDTSGSEWSPSPLPKCPVGLYYRQWQGGITIQIKTPLVKEGQIDHIKFGDRVIENLKEGNMVILYGLPEDVKLSMEEMIDGITILRETLEEAGLGMSPLMIATGRTSSTSMMTFLEQAREAGATHALLSFPSLPLNHLRHNRFVVVNCLRRILDASPLPIMLDVPALNGCGSLSLEELMKLVDHPMCFGVKMSKISSDTIARLKSRISSQDFTESHSENLDQWILDGQFQILHTQPDLLLSSIMLGYSGCVLPPIHGGNREGWMRLYELTKKGIGGDMGALMEAGILQAEIAA